MIKTRSESCGDEGKVMTRGLGNCELVVRFLHIGSHNLTALHALTFFPMSKTKGEIQLRTMYRTCKDYLRTP